MAAPTRNTLYGFDQKSVDRIARAVRGSEHFFGGGGGEGLEGPLRSWPPARFWARITSNTQDGSNKRWSYAITEVCKSSTGYGGWTDVSGGRTGTAYNVIEDQNGATGTWGNGVASTELTGTFDIKPVPNGTRVLIEQVILTNGNAEYWFTYENGVSGACEEP